VVKTKVVELKRPHLDLGIQKISLFLRRVFFLPVSWEAVRRTLHEQRLLKKRKPKPQPNLPKPRFFGRSTPNQMWQTDIFTLRLGGKNAISLDFWMITPATWWDWTCFAARRPSTCWRCIARRRTSNEWA